MYTETPRKSTVSMHSVVTRCVNQWSKAYLKEASEGDTMVTSLCFSHF